MTTASAGFSPAIRFTLAVWVGATGLIAALIVLLPLHLEALGFGVDATAVAVGAAGVGGVLSADPVGRLAETLGPVQLIRVGVALMAISVLAIGVLTTLWLVVALHAVVGVGTSAVRVGAQMVVRSHVVAERRGRVHGLQGLTTRGVSLAVPVGIGFIWDRIGAESSFALAAALALVSLVAAGGLEAQRQPSSPHEEAGSPMISLATMLRYASGPILFQAARGGRLLLLPLVGLELGLSAGRIGLLVGLTAAADVIVSPLSGPIMDGRGRLATVVPAFSLMTVGFMILGLGGDGVWVAVAAVVLGLGNGLTSGLLLTLGSDLAPKDNEGPFLGRFGALSDIGRLVGPFVVGFLGRLVGLGAAAIGLAVVTALALACVVVFVGETKPVRP